MKMSRRLQIAIGNLNKSSAPKFPCSEFQITSGRGEESQNVSATNYRIWIVLRNFVANYITKTKLSYIFSELINILPYRKTVQRKICSQLS